MAAYPYFARGYQNACQRYGIGDGNVIESVFSPWVSVSDYPNADQPVFGPHGSYAGNTQAWKDVVSVFESFTHPGAAAELSTDLASTANPSVHVPDATWEATTAGGVGVDENHAATAAWVRLKNLGS